MKRLIVIIGIVLLGILIYASFVPLSYNRNLQNEQELDAPDNLNTQSNNESQSDQTAEAPLVSIYTSNLEIPWGLAFLPDNSLLVTERTGSVLKVMPNGQSDLVGTINESYQIGEGGLLGIALHPEFEQNNYVYLYYTFAAEGNTTYNRVERYTYSDTAGLSKDKIIVDQIPGSQFHNGGRIKFGPDNHLYITTGDAQEPSLSQTLSSLAGKILRVTSEGEPVDSNPFGDEVYSYGHRNPQGLAWDNDTLWEVEHGSTNFDEVNVITAGNNYGWPNFRGNDKGVNIEPPVIHSNTGTWAPGAIAYLNGKLYFTGLRGSSLYVLDKETLILKSHFVNEYGRLRDIVVGPDDNLYITTSNRDGRGTPAIDDDKILRVNPRLLP